MYSVGDHQTSYNVLRLMVDGHKSYSMHSAKSYLISSRWTQILQHADHCREGRRGPDGVPTENAPPGALLGQQVK